MSIALVTGGNRGIGRAIVEVLEAAGHDVIYTYHMRRDGGGRQLDIGKPEEVQQFLKTIPPPVILVNNAAMTQEKPFLEITDEEWGHMLSVNLLGAVTLCRVVIPHMIKNGWGRIVNVASIGGQWGGTNQVHYAASKAALINFTQSLARLYSRFGITVNAIAPGLVRTDMSGPELETEAGAMKAASIPVGCVAEPRDVAYWVEVLVSSRAGYMTGQTLNVNGGMYFG